VDEVYLCGLARDVCVLWSAQDAQRLGFRTHVLWELTRPVTPAGDAPAREALRRDGIDVIEAASSL
jgi:nicotinamidase/pyrazinamidase